MQQILARFFLWASGVLTFGPRRSWMMVRLSETATAAFDEAQIEPTDNDMQRVAAKISWFMQTYQRVPSKADIKQFIAQLSIK